MSMRDMLKSKNVQISGASLLAFALGAGVSYLVCKEAFNKIADEEIREVKAHYRDTLYDYRTSKKGIESDPTELLKSYSEHTDNYKTMEVESPIVPKESRVHNPVSAPVAYDQIDTRDDVDDVEDLEAEIDVPNGVPGEEEDSPEKELLRNIFTAQDPEDLIDDWDYEEELESRSSDEPYVISFDEFNDGSENFEQSTVTYFEGDDVLSDEADKMIDDIENTVGEKNLYRFGNGSRDNNVVYVRNEKLNLDFEVLRSERKYAQEVLGFIEHSDKPGIRKFRSNDW